MTAPRTSMLGTAALSLFFLLQTSGSVQAAVRISEVADKGTSGVCQGNDWVELYNDGADGVVDLTDYVLHDDKGINHAESFSFPDGTLLQANEYLLLCNEISLDANSGNTNGGIVIAFADPMSPQFGIGGDDIVSLVRPIASKPADNSTSTTTDSSLPEVTDRQTNLDISTGYVTISLVQLPNTDDDFDVSYAWNPNTGLYNYTSTPTPGSANVITELPTEEEQRAALKAELADLNALGTAFFNMDDRGMPVPNGMDDIVDIKFTMKEPDYQYIVQNRTFELYRPFAGGVVTTVDGETIATVPTGEIRAKGQSSLFMSTCLGTDAFPFQVEFDNATNKLFGMERFYLRNHIGDYSYMRDWAYNRMLARFGLPHLRARKVRFYINENLHGLYTLLEAPDQDYVFHRSFPNFDPNNYALFKVKSFALECGSYTDDEIAKAQPRMGETSTPPYAFQRGEHKQAPPQLGLFEVDQCVATYDDTLWGKDFTDVVLAWLRYDRSCADMLMEEGLIDRDLGTNDWDDAMHTFIDQDFRDDDHCEPSCSNSNLAETVDQENWLKMFAFYAVTMNADSPLVNGNNYYMAQTGAEAFGGKPGWKIFPYDFNLAAVTYCHDDVCNDRMVHWSIARPTCESLESNNVVGPLLSDESLHAQYLGYVKEFVDVAYGNASLVAQMEAHAAVQKPYVREDFWSTFGAFYDAELTADAANWEENIPRFPLLPTMKARTEDVRAQLAAIEAGTYPRGPFVGAEGNNEPLEYCPDWRLSEPNTTACEQGCQYEGCVMPGWTVEYFCDEETGKCIHGDYDERCRNIYGGTQYRGMEPTEDGRDTFCRFAKGIPIKAAECPAVGAVKTTPPEGSGAANGSTAVALVQLFSSVILAFVCLLW